MLSLAGSVLLVVCLNISGMMLVRGASRERELSIRAALGADRQRLIQHLFFEAILLAVCQRRDQRVCAVRHSRRWRDGIWARRFLQEIDLDAIGVLISSGLCLVVSVLFGLLPAVRFSRPNLIHAMKDDAGGGGRQTIRVHRVAAMVQVGIAVPFLVISGVMLDRVRTADFGFPTDGLAARAPAGAGRTGARGRVLHPAGFATISGRPAACALWRVAEGMPIDFDYREFRVASTTGREVCHRARHARRRKLPRDHRRAAAARANDHRRGPHDAPRRSR